jgi:hypothetical protein
MARPYKAGLDYFPLDTDFFTNKKIKNLRRAHGTIGVLTYLNLLCRVYSNGYYYRFYDIEELSMDIAEEIANAQLRSVSTSVTETINYLVGRGILSQELFERGIISGEALQEQYVLSAYKAKRQLKMDVHCLVDVNVVIQKSKVNSEEIGVNSEETKVNLENGTQSKVSNTNNNNSLSLSACARVEPTIVDAARYFEQSGLKKTEALREAEKFIEFNASRSWDCLKKGTWEQTADSWLARKEEREEAV